MVTVSYSEFRADPDKYLEAVERGETLEVSREGKPVAIVSPARRSAKDYWKQRKPLPIRLEGPSLTEVLLKEREEGR